MATSPRAEYISISLDSWSCLSCPSSDTVYKGEFLGAMYWAHRYISLNNPKHLFSNFIQMASVDEVSSLMTPLAISLRTYTIIPPEFLRALHFFFLSLRKLVKPFICGHLSPGPSHDSRITKILWEFTICMISGLRHFTLALPPILRHPIFKLQSLDI